MTISITGKNAVIFLIIIVAGAIGLNWYIENYTGLRLELSDFSPIINNIQDKDISGGITNHDAITYDHINVVAVLLHSSDQYLQIQNVTLDQPMTHPNEHKAIDIILHPLKSEGYILKYKVNLEVFANNINIPKDTKNILVTMGPFSNTPNLPIHNQEDLKLDTSTPFLTMKNGDTQNMILNVKSNTNKTFNNMKFEINVENSSGQYMDIPSSYPINKILTKSGDSTGDISIPITIKQSEGYSLEYKIDVTLYSDSFIVDSKQIDVTITS